jgi:hypothetical protein
VAGIPPACDDQNPCTTETCDPAEGCKNVVNSLPCDDGSACTQGDSCSDGSCSPGKASVCSDGNPCSDDSCNPANGCVFLPNAATCDDGNGCSVGDLCQSGTCTAGAPLACSDANPCTSDACDPLKGCVFAANTLGCDDGNVCTSGDVCAAGSCSPGAQVPCSDGNLCTGDACDTLKGCVFSANTLPCDDGNVCSVGDTCGGGSCGAGAAKVCTDSNPCTADSCDPQNGCQFSNNSLPCSDGSACTSDDCDGQKGCVFLPNSATCSDANACTSGDQCGGGTCAGKAIVCDDGKLCTTDYCDSGKGCQTVANSAPCDDGTVCTASDLCSGGSCGGKAVSCDDANACTTDSCDAKAGCGNVALPDGSTCTGGACQGGTCVLSGLIAWYTFDEGSGSKFSDSSGNGYDGSHNAPYVAGKKGKALSFSGGAMAKVSAGGTGFAWGANNADYTIEYWIYVIAPQANWVSPLHKSSPGGGDCCVTGQRAPAQFFYPGQMNMVSVMGTQADSNHYAPAGTGALPLATWTHFATVHSGAQQLLYINGVLVNTDNLGSPTEGGPGVLYLGNDGFYAPLDGYMDEVRVYQKALTAKQILADML